MEAPDVPDVRRPTQNMDDPNTEVVNVAIEVVADPPDDDLARRSGGLSRGRDQAVGALGVRRRRGREEDEAATAEDGTGYRLNLSTAQPPLAERRTNVRPRRVTDAHRTRCVKTRDDTLKASCCRGREHNEGPRRG